MNFRLPRVPPGIDAWKPELLGCQPLLPPSLRFREREAAPDRVMTASLQRWASLSASLRCVQGFRGGGGRGEREESLPPRASERSPRRRPLQHITSLYPALLSLSPKSQGKRRVTHCQGRPPACLPPQLSVRSRGPGSGSGNALPAPSRPAPRGGGSVSATRTRGWKRSPRASY